VNRARKTSRLYASHRLQLDLARAINALRRLGYSRREAHEILRRAGQS